jgi:hypothetical protein
LRVVMMAPRFVPPSGANSVEVALRRNFTQQGRAFQLKCCWEKIAMRSISS